MSDTPAILVFGKNGQVARELGRLDGVSGYMLKFAGREACDLLVQDPAVYIQSLKPHGVINASAYTAVDRAESEPDLAFRLNSEAVAQMAHACKALGIPFVHMSTDYVFDGQKSSPYVETDVRRPLSVYGASKLAGEQAMEAAGLLCTVLRTSWVFSPFGSNFIKTMRRLALERPEVSVVADQWGRPTLAKDIAVMALRAAVAGAEGRNTFEGVFHIAGADDAVWADIAEHVFLRLEEVTGNRTSLTRIKTDAYPTPAKRPTNSRLDSRKLQNATTWSPRPWRDTVDECLSALTDINRSNSAVERLLP